MGTNVSLAWQSADLAVESDVRHRKAGLSGLNDSPPEAESSAAAYTAKGV